MYLNPKSSIPNIIFNLRPKYSSKSPYFFKIFIGSLHSIMSTSPTATCPNLCYHMRWFKCLLQYHYVAVAYIDWIMLRHVHNGQRSDTPDSPNMVSVEQDWLDRCELLPLSCASWVNTRHWVGQTEFLSLPTSAEALPALQEHYRDRFWGVGGKKYLVMCRWCRMPQGCNDV